MLNEYTFDKAALRRELIARRDGIPDKPYLSRLIADRVIELCSGRVMVYVSIGSEVQTRRLISELTARADIELFVPSTKNGIITPVKLMRMGEPDCFGNLPEDCYIKCESSSKIDCSITPLLGFNSKGYRIGYGKGCYDRFFCASGARRIGLSYAEQEINFMPEAHDVPLDCCVTEKSVIYF